MTVSFWTWLAGTTPNHAGITENVAGEDYSPGDPNGLELKGEETFSRSLPVPMPSPWDGWPTGWSTPNWSTQAGLNKLIDTAWACLDLNSSVLSAMPVYRTQSGTVIPQTSWMSNPDPMIYNSWQEFAKQLFWDYQMGEAFVLSMVRGADGYPLKFRVIPPPLINVEMSGGTRVYRLGPGGPDVTDDILHIRYQSTTADAHGHGPLECAGARMTTAGMLQRYTQKIAETGGVPLLWFNIDRPLNKAESMDILDQWRESRMRHVGEPAVVGGGAGLNQMQSMSARDMTLLELAQFTESGIAILLGVPPYMVSLPGPGGLIYANVSQLTDHHDRASLKPKVAAVMSALSGWALPRGQTVELNRDEYTRPAFKERADAYKVLHEIVDANGKSAISVEEIRAMERLQGEPSAVSLTGGNG